MRVRFLLSGLGLVLCSCAIDAAHEPPAQAPAAPPVVLADEEPTTDPLIPSGTYATLQALCAEQEKLAAPLIAARAKERASYGEEEGAAPVTEPSCTVTPQALDLAVVSLRPPFLEASAITVEGGDSTRTHVVVRTVEGWRAIPNASIDAYHEDPGCFSIERESGIRALRVEGDVRPALVIVEGTDRGARMEEEEGEQPISWSDLGERARACRIAHDGLACDDTVLLRLERVPSTTEDGRKSELLFETTSSVTADGHLVPAKTYAPVE